MRRRIIPIFKHSNLIYALGLQEVEKIEVRRMVDISGEALVADRKTHQKKMEVLKQRMTQAKKEQNELKSNLGKFNTFVREKQSKDLSLIRSAIVRNHS